MADMNYMDSNIQQPQAQWGSGNLPGVGANMMAPFWSGMQEADNMAQNQNKLRLQNLQTQGAQIDLQNKVAQQPSLQSGYDLTSAQNTAKLGLLPQQTQQQQQQISTQMSDAYHNDLAAAANRVKSLGLPDNSPQMISAVNDEYNQLKQRYPNLVPSQINPALYTSQGQDAVVKSAVGNISQQQAIARAQVPANAEITASQNRATGEVKSATIHAGATVKAAQTEADARKEAMRMQVQKTIEALSPDKAAMHFIMEAAKEKRPLNEYEAAAVESAKADKINQAASQIANSPAFISKIMQAGNDPQKLSQVYAQINTIAKQQAMVGYEKLFGLTGTTKPQGFDPNNQATWSPVNGQPLFHFKQGAKTEDIQSFNNAYSQLNSMAQKGDQNAAQRLRALVQQAKANGDIH